MQFGSVTFVQDHFGRFSDDFLPQQDRATLMFSLCSTPKVASIDMYIDILRSSLDLEARSGGLRSSFDLDLSGSKYICVDAS